MSIDTLVPFVRAFLNAILIGLGAYIVAYIVGVILRKGLVKFIGEAWSNFLANLSMLGIMIWAANYILEKTGAAGAVVLLATAITGAFAIGSERLAADLVSGLIIFFSKPFEIGDYINVGEYEGDVVGISLTTTKLNCFDGTRIILRNSTIQDNTIINYSTNPAVRISVTVPVSANEDLEKAANTLQNSLASFEPQVRGADFPATVLCETTHAGYAEFQIRVYIPKDQPFSINRTRLFVHGAHALKEAGIGMKA